MPTVTVHFRELLQDSQDVGGDDEHMVSRVLFDIEYGGQVQHGLHADIKQTVGAGHLDPVEVGRPTGLFGRLDHEVFVQAVEAYYRGLIGATSSGIKFGGVGRIRMRNNRLVSPADATFDVAPGEAGW